MAKKVPTTGRPSIFRGKDRDRQLRVYLSAEGHKVWEKRRKELARMTGRDVTHISDGDVAEFVARGLAETVVYLQQTGQSAEK